MKIESCGKNNFLIFINSNYEKNLVCFSKEEFIDFVRDFIYGLKNKLNIYGFYKVLVRFQRNIGVFLEVIKLDDIEFSNNLDLRILIINDDKFYFETEEYELIKFCNDKRFKDGLFYCVVDDSFDNILEKVEFGRFLCGKEVINLLNNSLIL